MHNKKVSSWVPKTNKASLVTFHWEGEVTGSRNEEKGRVVGKEGKQMSRLPFDPQCHTSAQF